MLDEVVQSEPPASADPLTLGMFASIGVQRGSRTRDATARAPCYRFRQREACCCPGSTWRTGFLRGYQFQGQGTALLDSAVQLYFWVGATNPGMAEKMVGDVSRYALAVADTTDAPFHGAKTYRLHVPPTVPVNNFWSVLVYDTQTRSMLQTDQQWPSVASDDKGLARNEDGSVDVVFGPRPPGDGRNWIQTLRGKRWFAIFRLYGPLEPCLDKTWRLPDIVPVS